MNVDLDSEQGQEKTEEAEGIVKELVLDRDENGAGRGRPGHLWPIPHKRASCWASSQSGLF